MKILLIIWTVSFIIVAAVIIKRLRLILKSPLIQMVLDLMNIFEFTSDLIKFYKHPLTITSIIIMLYILSPFLILQKIQNKIKKAYRKKEKYEQIEIIENESIKKEIFIN